MDIAEEAANIAAVGTIGDAVGKSWTTDAQLKRQVAIKILPPSLAADSDRLARLQREAKVLGRESISAAINLTALVDFVATAVAAYS